MQPSPPAGTGATVASAVAIVLGVLTLVAAVAAVLVVALGTSFFAIMSPHGDGRDVVASGCAFAVPLLIAFLLGIAAIVAGARRSVRRPGIALALGAIGFALVPAAFYVPWVVLHATAPRERLNDPHQLQYSDPDSIGRDCHSNQTLRGDCDEGFSCMGGEFANPSTGLFTCQIACGPEDHCPYRTECTARGACELNRP